MKLDKPIGKKSPAKQKESVQDSTSPRDSVKKVKVIIQM